MNNYKPLEIEVKWQDHWQENQIYRIDLKSLESDEPKFYGFGMFNYPSGEGIHVGHVKNFTIPDVLVRYYRQKGYKVYSPVGFDSFGSPTENYALKTGLPPRQITDKAIENYRQQYQACGFSFDWSKVIDTSQPEYYKWTQWCFLQLYKAGLAYRKQSSQWWCESCQTVLADEQVINGKCWRHDSKDDPLISRKHLEQWFFKITDYADKILEATNDLNWTNWVKVAQKNYIGRSEGVEVSFKLEGFKLEDETLTVFTTALETIYGATFLVLSPEHPLVERLIDQASNGKELKKYVQLAQTKSEVERQKAQDKTGIKVEGLTSINPLTKKSISVWIADYVLAGYGTGSIMAVPSADERDLAFAKKHDLPIVHITDQQKFISYKDLCSAGAKYKLVTDDNLNGTSFDKAYQALAKKLRSSNIVKKKINYKLRDWLISRQRYWGAPIPIVFCDNCGVVPIPEKDLPVLLPEIDDYKPAGDGRSPLSKVKDWMHTSCPNCQAPAKRETDTMDGYVCSSWYQMRYLSPYNSQQAWDINLAKKWFPVDFYNGADHATAHLLYARFFSRFFYEKNYLSKPEPFKQMYLHAKILAPDGQTFSKSKGNGINPIDIIEQGYGADALRLYLCAVAPPNVEVVWSDQGVPSAYKFLSRVYALVETYLKQKYINSQPIKNDQLLAVSNRCIAKVEADIKKLQYHTAIAQIMKAVNSFYKISKEDGFKSSAWQECLEALVMMLAPFTPHIASELWQKLGHLESVHIQAWPKLEAKYLKLQTVILPIQINGKLRAKIEISTSATKAEVVDLAKSHKAIAKYLDDSVIKKEHYVENRILNFVVD